MKRSFKKYFVVVLAVIMITSVLLGCNGCKPTPTPPKPGPDTVDIDILPDLYDLSVSANDYAPSAVTYESVVRSTQADKLLAKQESEKEKHNYIDTNSDGNLDSNFDTVTGKYAWDNVYYDEVAQEYVWDEDGDEGETTTFTKIFLFCDINALIGRMAAAALPQDKMIELIDYITRDDPAGDNYLMTAGTGSAIRDYEELDELYDVYDEDDSDDNYKLLQRKRRKVMHEVFGIFQDDAASAARTAIEILAYAQEVVATEMIDDYEENTGSRPGFYDFFKGELFDYDTLVYFLAFNETCGATGDYLLSNVNYTISAVNKKEMTKLYGYYYQYQKKDFDLFNDAEYFEYLDLSLLDYYDNNADALKYRDYDREHYAGAYRYSAEFYEKYYQAHFLFQGKQEKQDIRVYGVDKDWSTSYANEMQKGCDAGMEATLKLSDVNWEYSATDSNVTNYNIAAKAYYSLPEDDRTGSKPSNEARLKLVKLRVEQLKSQHYTITHKSIESADLGNALKYQIYSFSGDYARTLLSNRKDDIYMTAERARIAPDDTEKISAKDEEIGRNTAMFANHNYFYIEKGNVTHQLSIANEYNWGEIADGMEQTIAYDFEEYQTKYLAGEPPEVIDGETVDYNDPVDIQFEDTLIKKNIVGEGANQKKEYDTDWEISRLLDNHENVFRYAFGQVVVYYMEGDNLEDYTLKGEYVTDSQHAPDSIIDPESPEFYNNTIKAISTSDFEKFSSNAINYSDYQEESYESDERVELALFAAGEWEGILPTNGNVSGSPSLYTFQKTETVSGNARNYNYYLIFEGWYVDEDLQYKAELEDDQFGEEYDYDIRLYPGYKVIKVLQEQ